MILDGKSRRQVTDFLNDNDIFSIRKYGKYRFDGVVKNTKKDNYVIKIYILYNIYFFDTISYNFSQVFL